MRALLLLSLAWSNPQGISRLCAADAGAAIGDRYRIVRALELLRSELQGYPSLSEATHAAEQACQAPVGRSEKHVALSTALEIGLEVFGGLVKAHISSNSVSCSSLAADLSAFGEVVALSSPLFGSFVWDEDDAHYYFTSAPDDPVRDWACGMVTPTSAAAQACLGSRRVPRELRACFTPGVE